MSGNSAFELVQESGWRRGLGNMLDNEFAAWWKTSMWWVQSLIWTSVIGFMVGAIIFGSDEDPIVGITLYSLFAGLFPSVAVVIIMQEAVVGEKQTGTAAWVLSKPVSRYAFILSKLAANSLGVLVTMVVIPGLAAYILLSIRLGSPLKPGNFLGALGIIWLIHLFFLTFALMLGTLYNTRGPVIGFSLALLFVQQYITGMLPVTRYFLPWAFIAPGNNADTSFISNLIRGQPVGSLIPVFVLVAEIVLFVGISLWRFEKEEF